MANSTTNIEKLALEPGHLWFTFRQNNSGGYCVQDENQGEYVAFEAPSAEAAWDYCESLLCHDYCECCGERWWDIPREGNVPGYYSDAFNEGQLSCWKGLVLHFQNKPPVRFETHTDYIDWLNS